MNVLTEEEVMARIASTNASTMQTAGIQAGAIVKVPGLAVPVLLVAETPECGDGWWYGFPVSTGTSPVLPGDCELPIGIVPYRVHLAHPVYVTNTSVVFVTAQLTALVLESVKSAAIDFLSGGDAATLPMDGEIGYALRYREWLQDVLAEYRRHVLLRNML